MSKVFIPSEIDINDITCVNVSSTDYVYFTLSNGSNYVLKYNNTISDYTLNQISSLDVACENVELTNEVYYRKDLDSILIIFFITVLIVFFFPFKIFTRLFGRWFKW